MNESPPTPSRGGVVRQFTGVGASAMAAVLWGFGGIFAKLCSAPGLVLTFYRLWIGAALFVALMYASHRRLTWKTIRVSWLGGVFFAGDLALFFSAVKLTSIVIASVIGAFQPALVLLIARPLFGERMKRRDVVWILLAMAGVAATVLGSKSTEQNETVGDLYAVGSLICWVGYWLVSKSVREHHEAMEYTTGVTITAGVVLTPIVLLSSQSLGGMTASAWFWVAMLAIVPGSGHLLMNWAHRHVDASVSSTIGNLNPLVASLAAIAILGQLLTVTQVIGLLVGLAAITMIAVSHRTDVRATLN